MSEQLVLAPESIEALAVALAPHVAEHLRDAPAAPGRYGDAAALARALNLSVDTVYRRAVELGGVRILTGPKGRGRWRFDLDRALGQAGSAPVEPPTSRRRRPAVRGDVDLLPIHGEAA